MLTLAKLPASMAPTAVKPISASSDLNKLVYFDREDGRLLVSKDHFFNATVRSYTERIKGECAKSGLPPPVVQQVAMDVIAKMHHDNSHADEFVAQASEMQKAAKTVFKKAVERRASDIHIRVFNKGGTKVFFRIHNDLHLVQEDTATWGHLMCSAIYTSMCDVADATFDVNNRQDARISGRDKVPPGLDGIRVATTPQVDGNVMVLRLLYNDTDKSTDICALGYEPSQKAQVDSMKRRPTGINIISGPTGSGKSTTLQRTLLSIHSECKGSKHIITVEDPPEYPMPGIVQTPVANAETEEDRSNAFQAAIKATMRLDPNIIMIGEMRDTPSVQLAVRAAMTGHQVWSTVHANNAFAIIDRMVDLGVSLNIMADPSIVTGMICQRLLKVLCPHCKRPLRDVIDHFSHEDQMRVMGSIDMANAHVAGLGCEHCSGSGVAGRTVVAEVVVPDQKIMDFIRKGDRHLAINYWRGTGGSSMLEQAIVKINRGIVDPFQAEEEVGPLNLLPEPALAQEGASNES
ncbi:GspE/PulE family protein [Polaromonas sp. JS666]|uniref:GspE/PulE family protein n=1 Tax=Polaromonas sp. (strain JS666 / ATCC BAA-500) TaxID=296591 RepID=UPI0000538753|nr:ATPase, T2SS/T4P/T4SS family [Polaromonas sp. JS666]ABE47104.1 type II secretion system protein E [Polaromonas sp. JS666]